MLRMSEALGFRPLAGCDPGYDETGVEILCREKCLVITRVSVHTAIPNAIPILEGCSKTLCEIPGRICLNVRMRKLFGMGKAECGNGSYCCGFTDFLLLCFLLWCSFLPSFLPSFLDYFLPSFLDLSCFGCKFISFWYLSLRESDQKPKANSQHKPTQTQSHQKPQKEKQSKLKA